MPSTHLICFGYAHVVAAREAKNGLERVAGRHVPNLDRAIVRACDDFARVRCENASVNFSNVACGDERQ